ncbi:phage integrase family protein [Orientia tsutsugamushi str. TA716]|uniref:Phage integrase family protein n=2 Tax=Orientia tsutsugamushi TaxID=784 RepID=A0A0F3P0K7_ORITS|nr:phage integrase family protein [Orientia tsutsugamushi str. TA716]
MRWDEISLSEKIWCIPKTKSKNGKTLYIGLADKLIEVLQNRKLCSKSEWVFQVRKTIVNTYQVQQYIKHG